MNENSNNQEDIEEDIRTQITNKMKSIIDQSSKLSEENATIKAQLEESKEQIAKLTNELKSLKEKEKSLLEREQLQIEHSKEMEEGRRKSEKQEKELEDLRRQFEEKERMLKEELAKKREKKATNLSKQTSSSSMSPTKVDTKGRSLTLDNADFDESLREATRLGEVDKIKKLISLGANLNSKDESGYTALHWAAINGKHACLVELIRAGANINITDHSGWTPLHYSTFKGHKDSIQILLIQPNIDVEIKNSAKKTAQKLTSNKNLSSLIKESQSPVVRSLLTQAKLFWGEGQNHLIDEQSFPEEIKKKENELIEKEKELIEKEQELNRKDNELTLLRTELQKKKKEEEDKRTILDKKEANLTKLDEEIRQRIEVQGESELGENVPTISLDDLVLIEEIGQGTFGSVHKAYWNGDLVAVKILKAKLEDTNLIRAFQAETKILTKLRHPNIITLMAASCRVPNLAIVTELMKSDLTSLLLGKEKIEWKERVQMAMDIARGMNYLHNMEGVLVHRDLKSGNTLVDEHYRVKISDFGSVVPKKEMGVKLVGTPGWMSPERLLEEESDERTDVFSFGVVLWEFLNRKYPWEGLSNIQIVARVGHAGERLPLPDQVPKGCPPGYLSLIRDCWETYPSKRPPFSQILKVLREMKV